MAKFLISTLDGKIRSAHNPPLDFSISGRFVVDVPQDLAVEARTDSLPELIHEKVVGIGNRSACRGLPHVQSDELLTFPNVDAALSKLCLIGPNKRCAMLPGGEIWTNPVPVSTGIDRIYFHWYGFTLWMDQGPQSPDPVPTRPDPPRVLYNYDPDAKSFAEFSPDSLTVEVWDSATAPSGSPIMTADFEVLQDWPSMSLPSNVRLRFVNQSQATMFLSDWIFLYDTV